MSEETPKVRRLLPRHYQMIDLAAAGHDNKTIAETLGTTPTTVGLVLRSPLVQAELIRVREKNNESEIVKLDRDAIRGKAASILDKATEKAALTQVALLDSSNESIRLRASESLLDRVFGEGADDRRGQVVNITAEHAQLLILALKESKNERFKPPADGASAHSAEGKQVDVCEASEA